MAGPLPDDKYKSRDRRLTDSSTMVEAQSPVSCRKAIPSSPATVEEEEEEPRQNASARLANPLADYTHEELEDMGAAYAQKYIRGTDDDVRAFRQGAVLAQDPHCYDTYQALSSEDREIIRVEFLKKWHQPALLYLVMVLCSTCAAVQGMDETVINGAQLFFSGPFGIKGNDSRSTWLLGLVNSAPYLCCAFVGCWMTVPFNHWFGRRGTIFVSCTISVVTVLWQSFTNSWWHMFIARFAVGFGVGTMSATVPIYAAETAPPAIRGALVMQWQLWTAFGIMLGYMADLAFYKVPDLGGIPGLNWRLMLGSAMVPALGVCCFVFLCPESPRWYMGRGRHEKAYASMIRLRFSKVQAARDIFYMHVLLEAEATLKAGGVKAAELFTVPRNRRALVASEILMFMQQFCGINVIAYYSSHIFEQANYSDTAALSASMGFGIISFLFAIPAVKTIDTFGRRNLLLTTIPFMALCLFFTGFSFLIPEETAYKARIACITAGIYLFGMVYSPGEGPVPFVYSAEAYPLYVRGYGMSLATATTWFFNFLLAITWPSMRAAFGDTGGFSWYAIWNLVGWVLVLLFVPETKGKTLEELDQVFSVSTRAHARYGMRQVPYFCRRYVLFQSDVEPPRLPLAEDEVERAHREETTYPAVVTSTMATSLARDRATKRPMTSADEKV
ncbi:MAG: hypothetical protein M1815_000772 [Lichina confinis]|nr:MAG: hypothetical protein M1815_000772 [Lichina confinis]